mgnify:FL=1
MVLRELELWSKRSNERHQIQLSWDSNVIGVLANGYDVHYGARSIKYEVERRVVNKLANAHENGLLRCGAKIHLVVSDDGEDYKLGKVEQSKEQSQQSTKSTSTAEERVNNDDGDDDI